MNSPVIETKRLLIVPFAEEYLTTRYVSWLNDPEVVHYSEQRFQQHTLESCRAYWHSFKGRPHYFWAIITRTDPPEHIGNMNAYVDPLHFVADMGILIGDRRVWGQGYGSEAWQAGCNYLLSQNDIKKITAGTLSVNKAMLKVMRQAGMRQDNQRPSRQVFFEDQVVELVYMVLERENRESHPNDSS
jgi:RimJ/RimL family protein N-acetyltransferase